MPGIQSSDTAGGFVPCGSHTIPWFVIWSRPSQERIALQELRNQDYPTILPLFENHLPSRRTRIDPLFPRYLFAQPIAGLWASMRYTRGVADVLRDPRGIPRHVPQPVIDGILAKCADDGIIYPPEPATLHVEEPGRVTAGPFAEFTGICSRAAKDRVWLLISIMGRPTEISFARGVVEAA